MLFINNFYCVVSAEIKISQKRVYSKSSNHEHLKLNNLNTI